MITGNSPGQEQAQPVPYYGACGLFRSRARAGLAPALVLRAKKMTLTQNQHSIRFVTDVFVKTY